MEIIDTWRLIKCLNHLLLVTLDLRPCISGVNSAFFFRNVLLSIEQKAIGASTLMETEVFVWIFFVWTPMLIILMDQFDWITAFAIVLCYVVLNIVLFWSTKHAIAVSYFQEKGRKESYSES